MNESNFKNLLSQRLANVLEEKFNLLEIKFNTDIQFIEFLKYDFYDTIKKCKNILTNLLL